MKPFELLVWGIVAILLVFGVVNLYKDLFQQQDIVQEIKEGIKMAQIEDMLGKTLKLETRVIKEGTTLHKNTFEEPRTSFAFECNNPKYCCIRKAEQDKNYKCENLIEWDYSSIYFKNITTTKHSLRCIIIDKIPVCRDYFGSYPAQARVLDVNYAKGNPAGIAKITVQNEGETNLINGEIELALQKMVEGRWVTTESEFPKQQIDLLTPQQKHEFIYTIETSTPGRYRANFTFSSSNSGFDKNHIDFNISSNENCTANRAESPETIYWDENNFAEVRKCTGCNYAYECATAWQNIYSRVNFEVMTKDTTYCLKVSEAATCTLEAGYDN